MNNTVTHSVDLLHGADDAVFSVDQSVQNSLDGLGMGGHSNVNSVQNSLALHLGLIGELAVDADTLAQALGQQIAGHGVQQLILQGRAAGVDHKNIHGNRLLFFLWESLAGFPIMGYNSHISCPPSGRTSRYIYYTKVFPGGNTFFILFNITVKIRKEI